MNNLYFACGNCKIYIDAGYRWVYWELEEAGVVSRRKEVNVDAVLAAESYWNPPKDENSRWLYDEVLPPLRSFISEHRAHKIVFGESEDFAPDNDELDFEWMQVGYLLMPTVRYLVEVLGLESWHEVCELMERKEIAPGWWEDTWSGDPPPREKGRQKFEELVSASHGS